MSKHLASILAGAAVATAVIGATAPADAGSTWAVVHGVTYSVSAVTVHGNTTTWALTPHAAPSTTQWVEPSPASIKLGITKQAGAALKAPTSLVLRKG